MSTQTIQDNQWSVAPACWTEHFEPWFLPMYRQVLEQLKPTDRQILLDAGCGSGLFSYMAIRAGAQVMGIDSSNVSLETARRRNPKNNFFEEDMEDLPFAADSFHFITGFNSFQYARNFNTALKEAARVLKPKGKLVIAIWDKPEMCDATVVLNFINALLPAAPPGKPRSFPLSANGRIEAACKERGLTVIHKTVVACPFIYRSRQEAISSFMGTGPAMVAMSHHRKETVETAIATGLRSFRLADDLHFLQNQFLVFIAEK